MARVQWLYFILIYACSATINPVGVNVFTAGEGGYPCIRIPAIASTSNGILVAFAECRAWIGDGCEPSTKLLQSQNINTTKDESQRWICSKRSTDGGQTWSNLSFPFGLSYTSMNPTVIYDTISSPKQLILIGNAYNSIPNMTVHQTISTDDGITWSKPLDIGLFLGSNKYIYPGPGNGVQLVNNKNNNSYYGRILWSGYQQNKSYSDVRVWYSDDFGINYVLSETVLYNMSESSLVELSNGSIIDNMRNNHYWACKCRGFALSDNGGTTFSVPYPEIQLISPICQGSTISLNQGEIILFSNPNNENERINMTVKQSNDNGVTWNDIYNLCTNCGAAYSCLTSLQNQTDCVGLLWETNATDCVGPSCRTVYTRIPLSV